MSRSAKSDASVLPGLALLALATVAVYWPLLAGRVPFPSDLVVQFPPWETVRSPGWQPPPHGELGDLATQFYPWKAYAAAQLRAGTLPLWQPHILLGTPFLAEPQTALFYPFNWLFLILPAPVAWALGFPVRTFLAGLGALLLARVLGAGRWGMALAGVTYAFAGYATVFQGHPLLDSALWLPFMCVAVDRLARSPSAGSVAVAAVAFAMPVLGGNPEAAFHAVCVACVWAVWRLARREDRDGARPGRRAVSAFLAAGVLALAVAAVQLVPTAEWLGQIERSLGRRWHPRPSGELVTFACRDVGASPNVGGVAIPEGAGYAGMLALLLAPLGVTGPSRRDARFWAATAFVALEVIYGWFPFGPLLDALPVFRTVPNWRLLIVLDLALAVLAGCGLSRVLGEGGEAAASRAGVISAGAAVAIAAGLTAWLTAAAPAAAIAATAWRRGPLSSAVMLGLATLALVWLVRGARRRRRRAGVVAALLAAIDMTSMAWGTVPFVRPAEIFPPSPLFDALRHTHTPPGRIASLDGTFPPNYAIEYGLDAAGGYDFPLRRTLNVLSPLIRFDGASSLLADKVASAPRGLLDLLDVRFLIATTWNRSAAILAAHPERFRELLSVGKVRVFENPTAVGEAFIVPQHGAVVERDDSRALERLRDRAFDPRTTVVLASEPAAEPPGGSVRAQAGAPAVVTVVRRAGEAVLRVNAAEPSIVVFAESSYPGWRVRVDGRLRPLLRADYAFLGVGIEPGAHTVEFTFTPMSVRIGAGLSAAGLLAVVALLAAVRRRSRHAAPE